MLEAAKGLRRLRAKSQVPQLRTALSAHRQKANPAFAVAKTQQAAPCPPTVQRQRFSTASRVPPEWRHAEAEKGQHRIQEDRERHLERRHNLESQEDVW